MRNKTILQNEGEKTFSDPAKRNKYKEIIACRPASPRNDCSLDRRKILSVRNLHLHKEKKRALEKEEVEKTRPDYNLFRRTHFKSSGQLGVAKRI